MIKGPEEQTRAIPAKVRRLEAKVARQSGWLETLHRIRPDLQMLKQLGLEVQEAKVKWKQLEKAVKGLQRELEVEEGEHMSTEELVLELKEVGEEVQVVDSHQREVKQLEEKLAELRGKVREGGAGNRSLDAVGREAKMCPGSCGPPGPTLQTARRHWRHWRQCRGSCCCSTSLMLGRTG